MVEGVEVVVQYLFGELGWGIQVNVSFVDSNVELDIVNICLIFVFIGLFGVKNMVLFYEKDVLQWCVVWNQ